VKMAVRNNNEQSFDTEERSLCIQEHSAMVERSLPLSLSAKPTAVGQDHIENQILDGDFVGTAQAVKTLFTLPSSTSQQAAPQGAESLVVHRIGNTLLFEDMSSLNEIAKTAIKESQRTNKVYQVRNKQPALLTNSENHTGDEALSNNAMSMLLRALEPPDAILPPPNWLPPAPTPSLHTYHWHFNDYRIVVGSDAEVYSSEGHPAVSLRTHEYGSQWERCTALDAYLDNIMSNIPELALCLEMKGFIHGYKLMDTSTIPKVNTADTATTGPRLSLLDAPLFDAKDVELNAAMLMRFLQANCKEDGGTYFLQRESMPTRETEGPSQGSNTEGQTNGEGGGNASNDCVRLYDLTSMSSTPTRKWKWLLAMMSYRFANRLKQTAIDNLYTKPKSFHDSVQSRQRDLLETCLGLLQELSEMGGNGHDMIRATAHDLIADSLLTVFASQHEEPQTPYGSGSASTNTSGKNEVANIKVGGPAQMSDSVGQPFPFALKRNDTFAATPTSSSETCDISSPSKKKTINQSNNSSFSHLIGWPGQTKRVEQFSKVEVSVLEKALDHVTHGLSIIQKMLDSKELEDSQADTSDDTREGSENDSNGTMDVDDIDDSVRLEGRRLRLRKVDLCLVLATKQMLAWRASSLMSNLREAAVTLIPLLPELKMTHSHPQESHSEVAVAVAWFWEIGGKLARALASDRYIWVEKAGVHPSDIVDFLGEMDDLLRGRATPLSAPPHLHQVAFSDPSAWMFHRDLNTLPLSSLGPPPTMASFHTASVASSILRKNGRLGQGRAKSELSSKGLTHAPITTKEKTDTLDEEEMPTTEFAKHPTPLYLACCLCAARALDAVSHKQSLEEVLQDPRPEVTSRLLLTRLGDACNEVGKALLSTVTQTTTFSAATMEEDRRLFAALVWFTRSLEHFRKLKDISNSALLLCNIASSKKLVAGRLPMSGKHTMWVPSESIKQPSSPALRDGGVPVMDLVESLLTEAIADCYASMECLGERGSDAGTWDLIASELAMAYLTLGVRRRQSLLKPLDSLNQNMSGHVSSGAAMRVAEPLEKAAQIYETLGDRHQLAATRYQSGTLWSRLWTKASEPKKARERLGLALAHYEAAHTFYLQGNGGRTLVMIDLDLFDLYTAVHAASSSSSGNPECLEKALLCLLETHHAFHCQHNQPDQRNNAELRELIRLSGLVGERLPKVLLQLTKTCSVVGVSDNSDKNSTSSQQTLQQTSQPMLLTMVENYKKLYLASIKFKWPSSSNDNEAMRQSLVAVGEFLQKDIHEVLVALRQGN